MRKIRQKYPLFLFLPLLLIMVQAQIKHAPSVVYRVGVYENPPLSFLGEDENPQGFMIDLLEEAAEKEGWALEYVPCQWDECLAQLEAGQIDLLGPIAYSAEREERFDFTDETALTNWGQVYVQEDETNISILDLEGQPVAVLQGDIHAEAFLSLLETFDIDIETLYFDSYLDIMQAVESRQAFAGVVNHIFALQYASQYDVRQSAIIFNPIEVRFAATKGWHTDLLAALDRYLDNVKRDRASSYYQLLAHWFQEAHVDEPALPKWIFWTGGGVAVFFLFLLWLMRFLRDQVRQATADVAESREELALIMDNIPVMISYLDRDQRYIYVDHSYADWYGFSKEEVVGKFVKEILSPKNYEKVRPNLERVVETGEEIHYEHTITRHDGEERMVAISYIPHLDKQGEVKAFFATVRDISRERQAEIDLRESEEQYRSLVDNTLVGIYILQQGRIRFVNQGLVGIFGYETPDELHGMLVQDVIAPEDWEMVREEITSKEGGEKKNSQYSFKALRRDGSVFNAEILSQRIFYQGKPAIQGILIDATARIEAEERFRNLSEASYEAIFISEKGICLEQNLAAERLFGYTLDEAIGQPGTNWIVEGDRDLVMHHMLAGYEEPYQVTALRKDGSTFPCEIVGRMMEYRGRKVRVTALRDISVQVNAEKELRKSEEMYRNIVENSLEGMFQSTFDGRFMMVNPALAKVYGYETPTELMEEVTDIREQLYVDGGVRDELINALEQGEEVVDLLEQNRRKDGSLIWIKTKARVVCDANNASLYIEGFVEDVTERVETENALRESEKKLREAQKIGRMGHWELDLHTDELTWSDEIYRLFEADPKTFAASFSAFLERIHPDDREKVTEAYSASLENGTPYDIIHRLSLPDQTIRYVRERCKTEYDAEGKPLRSLGTVQDVTEQVQREEAMSARLQLAEFSLTHSMSEFLQKTLDEAERMTDSHIGFYHFLNEDQNTISLQAWSTRTLGGYCSVGELDEHYPVDQAGVWVDCIQTREPVIHNDYASLSHRKGFPEGHAELTRELVVPVLRGDKIVAILGVGNKLTEYNQQDIDIVVMLADLCWEIAERKLAEIALQESEERLRSLINATPDIICFKDGDGRWLMANDADLKLFELENVDYVGKKDSELAEYSDFYRDAFLTCEDTDERAWQAGGISRCNEVIPTPAQGDKVYDVIKVPVFHDDGSRQGIVVLGRDITGQVAAQTDLEKHARQLQIVNTITAALSASLALEEVLELILQQVVQVIPCDSAAIFLIKEDGNLTIVKAIGEATAYTGYSAPVEQTLLKGLDDMRQPLIVDDAKKSPYYTAWDQEDNIHGWMGLPLYVRDTLVGYLTFDSNQPGTFSPSDAALAENFAPSLAQAIYNARLYERVIEGANDLEKHVQRRTEELQNFVELTADREIRMVELKETIQKLRTQLIEAGQTPVADDPLNETLE